MRCRALVLGGVAVMALSACDQLQKPERKTEAGTPAAKKDDARFRYSLSEDAAGDYEPLQPLQVGEWRLDQIFIAGPHSFENWISVDASRPTQAPLKMVLSGNNGELTLAPGRFDINERHVRFEGKSPLTGDYRFDGQIDLDALAEARRQLGSQEAVLKGRLEIGGRSFNNLEFKIKTGG